jgi:hypothetical protein
MALTNCPMLVRRCFGFPWRDRAKLIPRLRRSANTISPELGNLLNKINSGGVLHDEAHGDRGRLARRSDFTCCRQSGAG